jgi:hypothetical protein
LDRAPTRRCAENVREELVGLVLAADEEIDRVVCAARWIQSLVEERRVPQVPVEPDTADVHGGFYKEGRKRAE